MTDENTDVEREKNKSYELGHIAMLESLGEELRERSGELYGHADDRMGVEKAKQLKDLGREFEERAEERREKWSEKHDD